MAQTVCSNTVTTTTTTTQGGGEGGGGGGGGEGGGCRQEGHVCTASSPCCAGLSCIQGLCRYLITTTTTRTTTTTTTEEKQDCEYDCCKDETSYYDKECEEGYICTKHECVKIVEKPEIDMSRYYIIIIAILVVIIPAFVVAYALKNRESEWKKLYEKWSSKPGSSKSSNA